jgi:hypothetical protein
MSVAMVFCFGQTERKYDLRLSTGTVTLSANFDQARSQKPRKAEIFQGSYYRYIQFATLPSAEQKKDMAARGMNLLMYLPDNTFIASIKKGADLTTLASPPVRSLHPINARHKMLRELQEAIDADNFPAFAVKDNKIGIAFTYYESIAQEKVKSCLRTKGYQVSFEDKAARWFVVWVKKQKVTDFVGQPFVASAELVDDEPVPDNSVGRTDVRSNAISTEYSGGRKFNGLGVDVALQDDGIIGPHIDYQGRISNQFLTNNSGDHGDHCAGILMGAGNRDPVTRGMAWGSNIHVYSASSYQGFSLVTTHYNSLGIRIISTSYSDGCNAGYTTRAQQMDMQSLSMPELICVFSAGNNGGSNCGYGAGSGWGNVTGGHKHSKNTIAVANLDFVDVRNSTSSRGPAHDGRLKPEVSAVGTNVLSTFGANSYQSQTGTSMSCPAVAGVFAQLYHAYKSMNGNSNPPAALIKAIVMNTADDLGNPGPDFSHGYGRVNALNAVKAIEQGAYLTSTVANGAAGSHTMVVPSGVRRIKVMTYWHDYQAQIGAAVALVNDLNTTITDPSSTVHNPLVLSYAPNAASLNANAAPGIDDRNNHEQITINNPLPGTYTLDVNGSSVPMGPQAYFVTWIMETDGYTLTYPIGGEGLVPGVSETIRWDAFETFGNQKLEYTVDNGTTWTTISAAIPGAQRYYHWVPPVAISGQCRVRISRGTYSAESDTNFSIISTPSNLQVAWVCPDSVKLTWNAVPGVASYDVFKLGNNYMDSIGTSLTNSCVVTNIPVQQIHWFSVRSRGALNAVGRRAIAVQKMPFAFACPPSPYDVACTKVLSPSGTISDCQNLSKMSIAITLYNSGAGTLSVIPVFYRVDGGPVVSESYPGTLAPSASASFTFATKANFNGAGVHNIKAWADYVSDPVVSNDTSLGKLQVVPGQIRSLPLAEDFETFALCSTGSTCVTVCNLTNGFINEDNVTSDQHDWRTDEDGPPSTGTGPQVDFLPGTATGNYVYLESSVPCNSLTAHLLSPCVDISTLPNAFLSFGYHMNGMTMGTMYLDLFTRGTWTNSIWSMSGNQGDAWHTATVSLTNWATDTVTFRWRGVTGNGSLSDMALDAVSIDVPSTVGLRESGFRRGQTFMVFPNPGTDDFNIVMRENTGTYLSYTVSDITGRVVLSGKAEMRSVDSIASINLKSFSAGVYTLSLTCDGRVEHAKLYKI